MNDRRMLGVVRSAPEQHGLGRKASVGESDNERRSRFQYATDLSKYFDRLHHILNAYRANGAIKFVVVERQIWLKIQVMNDNPVQLLVFLHLSRIHPESDDFLELDIIGQMRSPTAHQIEETPTRRQEFHIELPRGLNRAFIDMYDQPRLEEKHLILAIIVA